MTLLASIPKNRREEYRVTRDTFKGLDLVQIRVWFVADDGEFRPSQKGVAIRLETLPSIIDALNRARSGDCGA